MGFFFFSFCSSYCKYTETSGRSSTPTVPQLLGLPVDLLADTRERSTRQFGLLMGAEIPLSRFLSRPLLETPSTAGAELSTTALAGNASAVDHVFPYRERRIKHHFLTCSRSPRQRTVL